MTPVRGSFLRRRLLSTALLAVAAPRIAWAQPASKLPRIGYMSFGPVARNTLAGSHEGFLAGLSSLGYVPGRTVSIEYRHAGGRAENLPRTAREGLDLHPDVVLAVGVKDVDALLKLSRSVPIVTVYAPDLVGWATRRAWPARPATSPASPPWPAT